jgi:hypothetical protein
MVEAEEMKTPVAIALLLLLSGCATSGAPWTREEVALEAAYLALSVIDAGQTLDCMSTPATCHEANPVVGDERPSRGRVIGFVVSTRVLHVLLVHLLPSEWRAPVQWGSVGLEAGVVLHNRSLGLQVNF